MKQIITNAGVFKVGPDGFRGFCPTGPGGGIDNSCGRVGSKLQDWASREFGDKADDFVNWFDGSVVTEDDGTPEVMYHHGSFDASVDDLNVGEEGMHFGTEDAARQRAYGKGADDLMAELEVSQNDDGTWGWSAGPHDSFQEFDTEDEAQANAEDEIAQMAENEQSDAEELGTFTKVYLAIKNPMVAKDQAADWSATIQKAKEKGHDGIVYQNQYEDKGSLSYIVFNNDQVRFAE